MNSYVSLEDALSDLKRRGYQADLTAETETVCLYCGELDMRLEPEEFHVDETYRFDCSNGRENDTMLYAISSPVSGLKGTLTDMEGTFSCSLPLSIKL